MKKIPNRFALTQGRFILFIFIFGLIGLPLMVYAENGKNSKLEGSRSVQSIKERLKAKYKIKEINIKQRPDGSIKKISMWGDFTPPGIKKRADKEEDYRLFAKAFINEEKDLFGISNINMDIKEYRVDAGPPGTRLKADISYHRYINGVRLDDTLISVNFDRAGKPFSVYARLTPITRELINAVNTGAWISEDEVIKIVTDDVVSIVGMEPENVRINSIEKYAIPEEPYVIWRVGSFWDYEIDAFTGKIVKKSSAIRY